uniref:ATP synthase F0 subunit 8 n=1 Tax=Biomphalaria choanomphala TaxID=158987 RepID=A0A2U8J9I7_BIOCH|nr:ATP synthase F0 subunit 8 [Biomphalaria choanomphala]AWK49488.1 ATP synthase F0 subunit 8 [Biomphalaria choanomphala]
MKLITLVTFKIPQLSPTSGLMIFLMIVIVCCMMYIILSMEENKPLFFCGS